MKNANKFLLVVFLICFLNYPISVLATERVSNQQNFIAEQSQMNSVLPSEDSRYQSYDYVIDQYNIDIVVNENNTLDITEDITAYFNTPKHGIFRFIPLQNTITRLDGTTSKNRTQVTNVQVNHEYTKSILNQNYRLQIGSPTDTVLGKEFYKIQYTYNLGKDSSKDYDELYYNLIGTEWDTVIGNVTFSITMPKEFDSNQLGFSSGKKGETDNDNISYMVNGQTIVGDYQGILDVGEGLTVRFELPEGYFVGAGLSWNWQDFIFFFIPVLFLLICIWLWYRYGRDDKVVETVEFYPPENFNSLEIGFLYKGKAEEQDVISLLIYLANKGYLKIEETEEKSLFFKTKGFKLIKLKEYDGNNPNERLFLEGIFKQYLPNEKGQIEVSLTSLYNNFYLTMKQILSNINQKENRDKIFEKSASKKKVIMIIMMIVSYCLITILPILTYGDMDILVVALLFPSIGFAVLMYMLFGGTKTVYVNGIATHSSCFTKIFGLVWGGFFGGIPWIGIVLPVLLQDVIYLVGYLVGIGCIIGMWFCLRYLPKRTPYGNQILGKIKGFKHFLEIAEKEKLEAMVIKNPTYFYDILPYTYVLGVSDKWIKKFEMISMQAPAWYSSSSAFTMASFGTFINSTMNSAQSAMSSSPSSSSRGSSSGGGFSGGGSGGGGGGSW